MCHCLFNHQLLRNTFFLPHECGSSSQHAEHSRREHTVRGLKINVMKKDQEEQKLEEKVQTHGLTKSLQSTWVKKQCNDKNIHNCVWKNSSTKTKKKAQERPRQWTEIENPAECRLGFQRPHADKQKFLN